ncbi:MAG: STAS domain-containing protein [Bryobacterales bacterium]|nr:STAS domain-containing protein [Bryobacterales bacterium]
MALDIKTRESGSVLVLELVGDLRAGRPLGTLLSALEAGMKPDTAGVVLNVKGLFTSDSAGIAELVQLYSTAKKKGLSVAMAGAGKRLLDVLQITRVDTFFPQYADEAAAVGHFAK